MNVNPRAHSPRTVQATAFASFLRSNCSCKACGGDLHLDMASSNQCGVVGQWHVRCSRGAACPHARRVFETSTRLGGEEYALNLRCCHAAVTCGTGWSVLCNQLRAMGMSGVASRFFYAFKAEFEDVVAHAAHTSMARAQEAEDAAAHLEENRVHGGCFSVDGGYACGRNAHCCTMPLMATDSMRIIHCEHARRKDPGATSSQGLEKRCFLACLRHPLVQRLIKEDRYWQVAMDGAAPLVAAAQAAGLSVAGDGWHFGKNRCKHFKKHVDSWSKLASLTQREREAKEMQQRTKPKSAKPTVAEGVTPSADQAALLEEWSKYEAYQEAQQQAKQDKAARVEGQKPIKEARKLAWAWERALRSMYRYVFEYTASLRGKINPATGAEWTKGERTAEAVRLYPDACFRLMVGQTTSATLRLLGHPASKTVDDFSSAESYEKYRWKPPTAGWVVYGSLVWEIMQSWVLNPICLSKFSYYIDNRMTAGCESWMSKMRKYVPKRFHFSRYYMLGVWMAILDHNENITRHVRGERWKRGQTLRHDGRWYKHKVRDPPTDAWRVQLWEEYRAKVRRRGQAMPALGEEQQGYVVDSVRAGVYLAAELRSVVDALIDKIESASDPDAGAGEEAEGEREMQVGGRLLPMARDPRQHGLAAAEQGGTEQAEQGAEQGAEQAEQGATQGAEQHLQQPSREAMVSRAVDDVAQRATTAALQRIGMSAAGAVETYTEEEISKLKVDELKKALLGRGLSATGNKKELVARLIEAAGVGGMQDDEGEGEDEDEGEEEEEERASNVQQKGELLTPAQAAVAAGVALEWHVVVCAECGAGLSVRLPCAMTPIRCRCCGVRSFAVNPHVGTRPPPAPKKAKRGAPHVSLIKGAYARIKNANPTWSRQQVFKQADREAREEHARAKEHARANEHGAPAGAAAAVAADDGHGDDDRRSIVMAAPLDVANPPEFDLRRTATVLGQLPAAATPLPPPAFMPLDQRPKCKQQGGQRLKAAKRPATPPLLLTAATRLKKARPLRPSPLAGPGLSGSSGGARPGMSGSSGGTHAAGLSGSSGGASPSMSGSNGGARTAPARRSSSRKRGREE